MRLVLVILDVFSILIGKMGSYLWGLGWNYLSIHFTHIMFDKKQVLNISFFTAALQLLSTSTPFFSLFN